MARKGILPRDETLDPKRCQFIKYASNEQCKKAPMRGRPFCRSHGGKAGRPIIHGQRSKYAPVPYGLTKHFEQFLDDPDYLHLRQEIALVRANVWQLAESAAAEKTFNPFEIAKLLTLLKTEKELVAQEQNRLEKDQALLTVPQLMMLVNDFASIVNDVVSSPQEKQQIASRLRLRLSAQTSIDTVMTAARESVPALSSGKNGRNGNREAQKH